jgi:hypothetical protein
MRSILVRVNLVTLQSHHDDCGQSQAKAPDPPGFLTLTAASVQILQPIAKPGFNHQIGVKFTLFNYLTPLII